MPTAVTPLNLLRPAGTAPPLIQLPLFCSVPICPMMMPKGFIMPFGAPSTSFHGRATRAPSISLVTAPHWMGNVNARALAVARTATQLRMPQAAVVKSVTIPMKPTPRLRMTTTQVSGRFPANPLLLLLWMSLCLTPTLLLLTDSLSSRLNQLRKRGMHWRVQMTVTQSVMRTTCQQQQQLRLLLVANDLVANSALGHDAFEPHLALPPTVCSHPQSAESVSRT